MTRFKNGSSEGGVAAAHAVQTALQVRVGPATGSEFNTFRLPLLPIACWRLENLRFDFDSSFIRPEASAEFRSLAALWHRVGKPPVSVFGHADPVGDDDYNKGLSGRRALTVYAVLTRKPEKWEDLFSKPMSGDNWGLKTTQMMLAAIGKSPGAPSGNLTPSTQAAVKEFQAEHGLATDGIPGPKTRRELFLAYMDFLCSDETGAPFVLTEADFLGQGQDPDGKAGYQGCGEFNPLIVFSKEEEKEFKKPSQKAARDAANQPNRRVLVFLFPPGTTVSPEQWPCPRAKEGVAECKKQFWPNADLRRQPQEARREYAQNKNTFACRFYDGMARRSPCETLRRTLSLRLLDSAKLAIADASYRLRIGGHDVREDQAGSDGRMTEHDVLVPSRVSLEWGAPQDVKRLGAFPYHTTLFLDFTAGDEEDSARKRLHNLGYAPGATLDEAVAAFQRDYELPVSGQLDATTRLKLAAVHDTGLARDE